MLACHYLDKLAVDHTVEWNYDSEEVSKTEDAGSPYFRSVLRYINLEKTLSLSNCDKFQSECDWPHPTYNSKMSHVLVTFTVFVGGANKFAVNEHLIDIDSNNDDTRKDDYF